MVAIITGDIVNSQNNKASEWIVGLNKYLSDKGDTPKDWEIYRGDEFQIRTTPENALWMAIQIKALIKRSKSLDVRMGIGIGIETFTDSRVGHSNGEAHRRSGRVFETLKEQKLNLAIVTGDENKDRTLNLILELALDFMDNWSPVSAEMVNQVLEHPKDSQQQMADRLGIRQSAVSQRLNRAKMDLVLDVLRYYDSLIKEMI